MRWKIEDTAERAEFRAGFRAWLTEVLPAGWMASLEADDDEAFERAHHGFDPFSWMRTIGASGYAAPLWPRKYGGLSGEGWMQQVVREELRRWRLPIFGINLLGVGLAGPTLITHASDKQKERWLAKILTGEEIWCQLFSEPGSGSDLASLATRAVRDGDEWVVNGQKVWTSIAQFAKWGMLAARTDPDVPKHEGLSYFAMDMKAPGVEVRPLVQATGSADFNEVFMTDVRIPDSDRIGAVGDGWRLARTTLMNERVALSGLSIDATSIFGGVRKSAWERLLESVPDRSDPVLRQQLARIYIAEELKEITSFRASSARMRGAEPGPEGAIGKVVNAELNQYRSEVAFDAGGLSSLAWMPDNTEGGSLATVFVRARANSIEGGTSEVLRNQIGERILGLPREPEVDKGIPWSAVSRG
jgi:alkylation response protein AidB-like acyl-CoA dehydrogenase